MKKIFTLILLSVLCFSANAQQRETISIWKNGSATVLERIDSITFEIIKSESKVREYVDLGLESGAKWATCNVGASAPEEVGNYYAWGEIEPKSDFSKDNYIWGSDPENPTKYNSKDGFKTLSSDDDVATVEWGEEWRMPTRDEMTELDDNCTWEWMTVNGRGGFKVTGPNGNHIFLPATGLKDETTLLFSNTWGHYWSGSLDSQVWGATELEFEQSDRTPRVIISNRFFGHVVRPVHK